MGVIPAHASDAPAAELPHAPARRIPHRDRWALAAVTLAVLLANLPYLGDWFDPDPLPVRSALASSLEPGLLPGKPTIDPNVGYSSQAIGHLAALDVLHLEPPWWNPYEATGMPLAGETQAAALFPPTLLTSLENGQLLERVLLELLAGISTLLLLRRIGLVRVAAVAGAITFALNGTFAWFAHAAINPVAFLPMVLLGLERAFAAAGTGRPGGWRLIAVATALSLLAGFPETAYIDALLAVGWTAWRCGCLARRQLPAFLARAAAGAVAGGLLAAPALVATAGALRHFDIGLHTGGVLGRVHLGGFAVDQVLLPYVFGPINGAGAVRTWLTLGGYVSSLLLAVAMLGLLTGGRRGLKVVLVGWIVLAFARMAGEPPVLRDVIGLLPGMPDIEFYRYAWPALELAVIVLAALGIDGVARASASRRRQLAAVLVAAAVTLAAALGTAPLARIVRTRFDAFFAVSLAWAGVALALAAAVALLRRPRARAGALATLLCVEAVGLLAVPELSAPRSATVDTAPVAYLRAHLGESRVFSLGPLQPNYGSYFRLAALNINDFAPRAYAHYVTERLDPYVDPNLFTGTDAGWRRLGVPSPGGEVVRNLSGYRAAAVAYLLAPAGRPPPEHGGALRLVRRTATTWIYRVRGAAGYFTAPGCRVTSRDRETARVVCPHATALVRRETFFPGWSATVDGRRAAIRRAAGPFQAVTVPAGTHAVAFSYAPPGIGWAGGATLAGCGLMLVPTARRCRRRRASAAA